MVRTVVLWVGLLSAPSLAECPVPDDAKPGSVAVRGDAARLAFLAKQLAAQSAEHERWAFGWGASYAVMTIGQIAVVPSFAREFDPDWWWGAATAALGLLLVAPASADYLFDGQGYARRAAGASGDDTCRLIAEGERLLVSGAKAQQNNTRGYLHAVNLAVNAGLAAILVFAHQRPWWIGALNFGLGAPLGAATLFSTPRGLPDALAQYRDGASAPAVEVNLVPFGSGVALVGRF